MADTEAVLTNISEMIDLAIGTPEVGVVDFCMLQTVLHCLAQQLRCLGKNVELRGSVASLPVGRPGDNAQTITVSEFILDRTPTRLEIGTQPLAPDQETMLVVERTKKSEPQGGGRTPTGRDASPAPGGKPSRTGQISQIDRPSGGQAVGPVKSTGPGQAPGPGQALGPGQAPAPAQSAGPGQFGASQTATGPGGGYGPGSQSATGPGGGPGPQPGVPSAVFQGSRSLTAAPGPGRVPSTEKLSLVTLSKFNLLENTVNDLKDRVYGSMPKNEDLLQEVRSQTNLKAITDMWTSLNVSSRLEACEEGIGKLSSLIQDLIGETAELQKATFAQPSATTTKMQQAAKAVSSIQKSGGGGGGGSPGGGQGAQAPSAPAVAVAQSATPAAAAAISPGGGVSQGGGLVTPSKAAAVPSGQTVAVSPSAATAEGGSTKIIMGSGLAPPPPSQSVFGMTQSDMSAFATKVELMQTLEYLQQLRNDLNNLTDAFYTAMKEVNENFEPPASLPPTASQPPPTIVLQGPPAGPGAVSVTDQRFTQPSQNQISAIQSNLMERLGELEKKVKKCCESITKSDGGVHDQLTSFQDQLEHLQKQVVSMTTNLSAGKLSPDLVKDLQGLMKLFQTVQEMQGQLKEVHETALHLASEKEERQSHIDALLEQIELLKTIKLDREDMVEALADKADLRMLARKVSHDQFETACDDLSKGLEHALGKLNVQEALWQQALDDIQREIETKLDKMELSPVKDFFNNKLKQLQENLKQMAALRRDAEAAGTKRRLMRDVNCISCDAKAVMAMEASPPLPPKPLPATLSMKPYLSYELDAIRKTQASSLPQRNMRDWEHIDKQMQPKQPYRVRSDTNKHLCNRYCGGSHTVTTPAQRVARLGHFIKQWGPEVLPLSSGFAAGDDGRLYKVSAAEGVPSGPGGAVDGAATCTPKSPVKKSETPKTRPLVISAECHCLDPQAVTTDRPPKS